MTNFNEISRYTAEIKLLPFSEKGQPPYWNFISGFDFDLRIVIGISFCICLPNRSNRTIVGGVMTSHPVFSTWRPTAILHLIWVMLDHSRSAIVGLSLILKFGLDPIYSFGDIAIFYILPFWLEIAYSRPLTGKGGVGGIFPQIWSPVVVTPKGPSLYGNTRHFYRAVCNANAV